MTTTRRLVYSLMMLFLIGAPPAWTAQSTAPTVPVALRLTIIRDGQAVHATCVLVRKDVREHDVVLYFVTAGHLFKGPDGDALPYPASIRVEVAGQRSLDVSPANVSLPRSNLVDVAVFSITTHDSVLEPPALTLAVPSVGAQFVVSGFDVSGRPDQSIQHVTRVATIVLEGSRPISAVVDCVGAPASVGRSVFGFVATCGRGKPPVIVPFAAIASWIKRYVPGGLMLQRAVTTRLDVGRRTGTRLAMTVVNHANRNTEDPLTSASEEVWHLTDRASRSARTF